ncbi:hypothetical protein GCM10029992_28000 [Glycomyces albus]
METLRHAIEDYLHGLDASLDLPMIAAYALARGIESPALAELAGLSRDSAYEVGELVPSVVEELSIDISPLPEVVFRKAREAAHAYLTGDLDFLTAARRVTSWMFDTGYLDFDERPDIGLPSLDDLWLLNEWIFAHAHGTEEDGRYYFKTGKDAESYFKAVATALDSPRS